VVGVDGSEADVERCGGRCVKRRAGAARSR
jgi:hypothetical protein